ncbi:MAG: hypothetical protein RBU30_21340 [Polyangia bacterium]|nr:hypothetical protein [Polyangia bacterium]
MALTEFQRRIVRLIAENRIASGESYVAGGSALNELLARSRVSRDIDLFHDTEEAVDSTFEADRRLLLDAGLEVAILRRAPGFIEAQVSAQRDSVLLQWLRDSAFRFFPLMEHADLGLTLHPFDLATNKVLALVGRLTVRDWVDVIACDQGVQPLGYLAWAACGKDPGFGPSAILTEARRSSRYAPDEVLALEFAGAPPDPAALSRTWRTILDRAQELVEALPPEEVGKAVLSLGGDLLRHGLDDLRSALERGELLFHPGCIRGAYPRIAGDPGRSP